MEEFLKNKYGIDTDMRLNDGAKGFRVADLISLLRESGAEKIVINNLHNGARNKNQALEYLDSITNQLIMEGEGLGF